MSTMDLRLGLLSFIIICLILSFQLFISCIYLPTCISIFTGFAAEIFDILMLGLAFCWLCSVVWTSLCISCYQNVAAHLLLVSGVLLSFSANVSMSTNLFVKAKTNYFSSFKADTMGLCHLIVIT